MREGWGKDVREWGSERWRRGGCKEEMGRRGLMREFEGSGRVIEGWGEGRGGEWQMNGVSGRRRKHLIGIKSE